MTTKVTIDAHAGWDIEVTTKEEELVPEGLERMGPKKYATKTFVVLANTKVDVYIWDNKEITSIKELKRCVY